MSHYILTAVAVIAILVIGIFAIQNLGPVDVSFLFWTASISKIIVILGTYVLGMLTGGGILHLIKGYFNAA
jgi:uncharacterized integral membrane protein